jgi:hypothetical protein
MALERVPADIRVEGGVARMSDPGMIKEIMEAVTIPVMAKARIGHFVECQVCPKFILNSHRRARPERIRSIDPTLKSRGRRKRR